MLIESDLDNDDDDIENGKIRDKTTERKKVEEKP